MCIQYVKMTKRCNFCTLKSKKCSRLNEIKIKCIGKHFTAQEALNIFKDEFIPVSERTDEEVFICVTCTASLQNCFAFVQQILKAQNELNFEPAENAQKIELNEKRQQLPKENTDLKANNKKVLRQLLPKEEPNSMTATQCLAGKQLRSYKCIECPSIFASFRQLKRHEATHDLDNISICPYCCSLFANTEALEKHTKEQHAESKYVCLPCHRQYKHKGHLLKHISLVHQRDELIYYCCLCPRQAEPVEYASKLALKQHFQAIHLQMTNHEADNNEEIEMNEEFLDEFLLHNANENSFQLSEWDELDLHLPDVLHLDDEAAKEHGNADNITAAYKCPKCSDHFSNQKTLLAHLAQLHFQQLLICHKCEASFQNSEDLWKHKAMHRLQDTVDHSGLCKICDKTFKSAAALNYHIKTHSSIGSRPHSCPYCGKQFQAHLNLKQHLRIVHAQLKKHVCLLCDKQFATLDHLKKHVLSQHQNERKHVCNLCSKRFTQLCHLKQHLAIHTTGKTLRCDACDASFWRKIDLERHILAKHKQKST